MPRRSTGAALNDVGTWGYRSSAMAVQRPGVGRIVLVAVPLVLVAAVLVGMWLWPRDRSQAVPVDEAVLNFRASTVPATDEPAPSTVPGTSSPSSIGGRSGSPPPVTDATTAAPTSADPTTADTTGTSQPVELVLPELGVYRYVTTGWEDIDALGGARHDYPAETTITVTADGCGVRLRWDALRERRDEWRLCATGDGVELQADGVQYHEFFGQPELEHLDCDRGVIVVSAAEPSPEPVVQSCLLAGDPWVATWSALPRSVRRVDGDDLEVWHLRATVDDVGEHFEHTTIDWYLDARGLPIAMSASKESSSPSPIGDVLYRETYELSIVSRAPLR